MLKSQIVFIFCTFTCACTNEQNKNSDLDNKFENSNHRINTRHLPQGQQHGGFGGFGPHFQPLKPPPPGNYQDFFEHRHLHPHEHQPPPHHHHHLPIPLPPPHHHNHPPIPPPPHGPFLEPHIHGPTCGGHQFHNHHGLPGGHHHHRSFDPHINNMGNNFQGQNINPNKGIPIPTASTVATIIPAGITTTSATTVATTSTVTTIIPSGISTTVKPDNSNANEPEENIYGVDLRVFVDDNIEQKQTNTVKS